MSSHSSISNSLHNLFLTNDLLTMYYAYAELGELEEEIDRSFHGYFKRDINVESKIGFVLPPLF